MARMVGAALGGLSSEQARARLQQQGPNVWADSDRRGWWALLRVAGAAAVGLWALSLQWPALGRLLQVQAVEPGVLMATAALIAGLLILAHRLVFR